MALVTTLIEAALATNAAAGDTETQATAHHRLAQAIVDTIELGSINYTAGLIAPSGGGPVTGTLATATIT
jgi:hypothetical protein